MTEPNKVVPINSEAAPKTAPRRARATTVAAAPERPPAMAPVVAPCSAELLRERARLAQVEAEIGILNAEIEGLAACKAELMRVAQASHAKIVVLEESQAEPRS